jgi:hypothetical protein
VYPTPSQEQIRTLHHSCHGRAQLREAESVAQELLGGSTELNTTIAVNHSLGKLFQLTAANRIPQRNAALLAYIGQLLLQSIGSVKQEFMCGHIVEAWNGQVQHALQVLNDSADIG